MNRTLVAAVLLALASPSHATPQVSGDGACGIRAVDNESFVTCLGERAPEPVGPEDARPAAQFPPAMPVSARQARQLKRDLGGNVLLVDLRGRAEAYYTGPSIGADAHVPFMEPAPGYVRAARGGGLEMEIDPHFLERMDEALRAAYLRHGDPVVLLCRTGECRREAAELLREHGYQQLFVVTDGFESAVTAAAR